MSAAISLLPVSLPAQGWLYFLHAQVETGGQGMCLSFHFFDGAAIGTELRPLP